MKIRLFLCTVFFMLAGCGGGDAPPAYHHVSYVLPATPGGRLCTQQCDMSRDYCAESCHLDHRSCINDVQMAAQRNYDAYARSHYGNQGALVLLPSDFEHPQACNAQKKHCLADCEKPYNACFASCGGSVSVTTSCQFLCFE